MDDLVFTGDSFSADWLAYRISRDAAGWRWNCMLGEEFATGTEPTEERAITMAKKLRRSSDRSKYPAKNRPVDAT